MNNLSKAMQEYYNRKILDTFEEEQEEEKRLGHPLTGKDRVRMNVNRAVRNVALMEALSDE